MCFVGVFYLLSHKKVRKRKKCFRTSILKHGMLCKRRDLLNCSRCFFFFQFKLFHCTVHSIGRCNAAGKQHNKNHNSQETNAGLVAQDFLYYTTDNSCDQYAK